MTLQAKYSGLSVDQIKYLHFCVEKFPSYFLLLFLCIRVKTAVYFQKFQDPCFCWAGVVL